MFQKYISETEIKNWAIRNIDRLLRKSYNLFTGKKQIKNNILKNRNQDFYIRELIHPTPVN